MKKFLLSILILLSLVSLAYSTPTVVVGGFLPTAGGTITGPLGITIVTGTNAPDLTFFDQTIMLSSCGNIMMSQALGNLALRISEACANKGIEFRNTAGNVMFDLGAANPGSPTFTAPLFTKTNCISSASPAICGSSLTGSVNIALLATSVVVDTTVVTANSQIFVTLDQSLSTALSVTCNSSFLSSQLPYVSARTPGVSFTVSIGTAPVVHPACYSFFIIN